MIFLFLKEYSTHVKIFVTVQGILVNFTFHRLPILMHTSLLRKADPDQLNDSIHVDSCSKVGSTGLFLNCARWSDRWVADPLIQSTKYSIEGHASTILDRQIWIGGSLSWIHKTLVKLEIIDWITKSMICRSNWQNT